MIEPGQRVSAEIENAQLDEAMKTILNGSSLTYEVVDNYIVLKPEEKKLEVIQDEEPEKKEVTLTGKVTLAEDGSTAPGVNVFLKGSMRGTITDMDGTFSFSVKDTDQILVFSLVGMKTVEQLIGEQREFDYTF